MRTPQKPKTPTTETQAVILKSFDGRSPLTVGTIALRPLKANEVLVQIGAASINPSDLVFLRDRYGVHKSLPVVPGFEGAGFVVDSGKSGVAQRLLNQRVACWAPHDGNGTWAEFMIANTDDCVVLQKNITVQEGASLLVNPVTAWALLQEAQRLKAKTVVITAALSAVGKMLIRLGRRKGISIVCIVRNAAQIPILQKVGARLVLCSKDDDFSFRLGQECRDQKIALAFDSVGGPLTGALMDALMPGGHVLVYGALSGEACPVQPATLIFKNKTLRGFWLTEWLKTLSPAERSKMAAQVQARLKDDLSTEIQGRFELHQINEAIEQYKTHRGEGKVLLINKRRSRHGKTS